MLEKEIIELRKEIESKLKKVNLKERIKIDTEILENLIFKIVPIPGENKEGKVIAWEGKFLSKIDLSELSFDDVILPGYAFDLGARYYDNKILDLSNTNINIDFEKVHMGKFATGNWGRISQLNLENVDLSKSNFESLEYVHNCNLTNTNLVINGSKPITFHECKLKGVKFGFNPNIQLIDCNIPNVKEHKESISKVKVSFEKVNKILKNVEDEISKKIVNKKQGNLRK